MSLRLVKRTGEIEGFQPEKIKRSLLLAFNSKQAGSIPNISPIVTEVLEKLRTVVKDKTIRVDDVADAVEDALMEGYHYDVAKAYIRYRARQVEKLSPDPLAMPEFIHADRYAQWREELSRRETFPETMDRVEGMFQTVAGGALGERITAAMNMARERKLMPSMRAVQFGGQAALLNNARVYNCSFTLVDRLSVFSEIFWLLLSGCGVGYSVQIQHVEQLPPIVGFDGPVSHHIVADTIEGWADAVAFLFQCATRGVDPEFSFHEIRPQGARLRTSGGRAPGHKPLKKALEECRRILSRAAGRGLRPLECSDMICHIAEAVLAGGIRRSSLIGLFSLADTEMLYSKAKGNFRPGWGGDPGLNNHRQMVNISAALLRGAVDRADFDRLLRVAEENYGDPGFMFVPSLDAGTNPCGEIGLFPRIRWCNVHQDAAFLCGCSGGVMRTGFGFCNLCEINAATVRDAADFISRCEAAALLGTIQASMTKLPYLGLVTKRIMEREALLGVGLTGIQDNPETMHDAEMLAAGVDAIRAVNVEVAGLLGIRQASRLTTIKPSGTASIALGGVASGIHNHWSERYFRRVTVTADSPVGRYFQSINPHMVEKRPDGKLSLVFCVEAPAGSGTVASGSASAFLDSVFFFYDHWVAPGTALPERVPGLTHNVSCTVTLREGDRARVCDRVWDRRSRVAALSFVPDTLDLIFPYAPLQAVRTSEDEAKWHRLCSNYRPVDWGQMVELSDGTSFTLNAACSASGCEVQ